MIFFTADEHYSHKMVLKYASRPFSSIDEMRDILIENNNKIVKKSDTVYHIGDFTFEKDLYIINTTIISKLNGTHIFIMGDHDYWHRAVCEQLEQRIVFKDIERIKYKNEYIVACHYPINRWPRSHYGSWHVHGHTHGHFQNHGKSWDVGVDNNAYTPVSFDQLYAIMQDRPQNENFIPADKRNKNK